MITLKNKLPASRPVTAGYINMALSEVQALFNSIGVTRGLVTDAMSDYFVFDKVAETLYLVTIEGKTLKVNLDV